MWDSDAKPGSTIAKLETAAYFPALDGIDRLGERKAEALRSGKFTPDGANDDALKFALNNLVPTFKRGRNAIAKARQEAAALRDKIKLQPLDKSDVVGFLQRQEIRDRLWEMLPEDRGKFLARNIDRLDPTIALAVLEMPADMSPAPDSVRNLMQARALEAQHGEAVTELQELERAIEAAESAIETGRDELRLECGVSDPHEFDRLAAPFEKIGGPWLRKHGNDVVVLQFKEGASSGTSRPATAEDIESGTYYRDRDHYDSERAA
jgi:hypothetical protein